MTDRAPQAERAERLRALHHSKQLLELVNVWDVASALEVASWPETTALATASAAIAASHGYEDGENIPRDLHLATIGRICAATSLPVTADLERGYDDVAATVRAGLDCGVVGANLEDDLCPVDLMTERVRAAVATGAAAGVPLVVNARTDVYLHGTALDAGERLREAQARGLAFLEAGADCVFVPGCAAADDIAVLVETFGPGRLSLLAVPGVPDAAELERLGVARLSHGPFPYRRALGALQAYRHGSPPAP